MLYTHLKMQQNFECEPHCMRVNYFLIDLNQLSGFGDTYSL